MSVRVVWGRKPEEPFGRRLRRRLFTTTLGVGLALAVVGVQDSIAWLAAVGIAMVVASAIPLWATITALNRQVLASARSREKDRPASQAR